MTPPSKRPDSVQTVVFYVKSNVFDGSFSTQFMSPDLSKIETLETPTFEELLTKIDELCYQRIPRSVRLKIIYEANLDR